MFVGVAGLPGKTSMVKLLLWFQVGPTIYIASCYQWCSALYQSVNAMLLLLCVSIRQNDCNVNRYNLDMVC